MNFPFLTRALLRAGVCATGLMAGPLLASTMDQRSGESSERVQDNQPTSSDQTDNDDSEAGISGTQIVVSGRRLRGQLLVEQAPLLELDEAAIASEGVTSIADLVVQISNQTGSARGRGGGQPVILVNGIRIGSFREFSNYPPEALARVEVFPEEVAQRFGFPPDRRVINLILKDNYRNAEVELEFEGPSRGGNYTREQEIGFLQIADGGRININLEANDTSLLTDDERGIIQTPGSVSTVPGDPDQAPFRSLVADSRSLDGNISWAKAIIDSGISLGANINYNRNDRRSLQGLNTVLLTDAAGDSELRTFGAATPLEQRSATDTFSSSGSLTKPVNSFRLTSTFDASLSESETEIDRRFDAAAFRDAALAGALALDGALPANADAGFEVAATRSIRANSLTTLEGAIANLPAGELLVTFDAGYDWTNLDSSDSRTIQDVSLTRGDLSTGVNLVVPITSRRTGFADKLGSFTLNAQLGINRLSDFGTLGDYTLGLTWAPTDKLDLSATYIVREVAPGLAALGNPEVTFLNTPIFDFTNGETVLATVTTGGNPDLLAETQRDWKFAANWELPFLDGARFTVEYVRNLSDDVTAAFPQITPDIEAAFPDRITRDANGTLIAVDRRSVTFAETRAERLQFGLSMRGSIGGDERGGERGGERPATASAAAGRSRSEAGARPAGGPPGAQSEGFAAFRAIACGEDGEKRLRALIARIDAGEDVSDELPGFDPQMATMILSRLRDADGNIAPERLAALRERFCSEGQGGAQNQQAGGGGGPPAGGFNPLDRGRSSGFRYFVSLNHTIELENEILITPGLAPLNQLDGEATGAFGLPRHNTRLEAGLFGGGVGMRLSGRYTGETRLNGSGLLGGSDIFFDDLATFDVRVFANLGELAGRDEGILKNLRVSLRADNIFDSQRRVTDENGETPLNYQPFLIDPVGRFIGIDLRKLF